MDESDRLRPSEAEVKYSSDFEDSPRLSSITESTNKLIASLPILQGENTHLSPEHIENSRQQIKKEREGIFIKNKELFKNEEFVGEVIDSYMEEFAPYFDILIANEESTGEQVAAFRDLLKQKVLTNDLITIDQQFADLVGDEPIQIFSDLYKKLDYFSFSVTASSLGDQLSIYTDDKIEKALDENNLTEEQKKKVNPDFYDIYSKTSSMEGLRTQGLRMERLWRSIKKNPQIQALYPVEVIDHINTVMEEDAKSRIDVIVSSMQAYTSEDELVSYLLHRNNIDTFQTGILITCIEQSPSPAVYDTLFNYICSEEGEELFTELTTKVPELEGKIEEWKDALWEWKEEDVRSLGSELMETVAKDTNADVSTRMITFIGLRVSSLGDDLLSISESDPDPLIQTAATIEVLKLSRHLIKEDEDREKGEELLSRVLTQYNIAEDIQPKLIEKYIKRFHNRDVGSQMRVFELLYMYPELLEQVLSDKDYPAFPLILTTMAGKENYHQLGKLLVNLLQKKTSAEDVFQFTIQIEQWPKEWKNHFNISHLQGLSSHLQWIDLPPSRRRSLLRDDLSEEEKGILSRQDSVSSENISQQYGLLLIRDALRHVMEDSQNEQKKHEADKRNRDNVYQKSMPLVPGTLLHGTTVDMLRIVLEGGDRAGEFLGLNNKKDETPFGADFGEVQQGDLEITDHTREKLQPRPEVLNRLQQENEFSRIYYQNIAAGYGAKPDVDRGVASDTKSKEDTGVTLLFDRQNENAFLKGNEYQGVMNMKSLQQHKVVLVGLPATEISGVIINARSQLVNERAKNEIIQNGFYIPIYGVDGTLLFTPEEYDRQRSSMKDDNLSTAA